MTTNPVQPSAGSSGGSPVWHAIVKGIALASAVFCIVMTAGLMANQIRFLKADPLNAPSLLELRERFNIAPDDSGLGQRIRAEDLRVRREYFHHQQRGRTGARLLLGGALVLLASLALLPLLHDATPDLDALRMPASEWKRRQAASFGLALGALILLVFILSVHHLRPTDSSTILPINHQPSTINHSSH